MIFLSMLLVLPCDFFFLLYSGGGNFLSASEAWLSLSAAQRPHHPLFLTVTPYYLAATSWWIKFCAQFVRSVFMIKGC